jgi:hypothetical protein
VAMQLHALFFESKREGLVLISRVRIAASRVFRIEEFPCMDVPPVITIFVLGAGEGFLEALREDAEEEDLGGKRESAISVPAADGGARGACTAAGLELRRKALDVDGPGLGFLVM